MADNNASGIVNAQDASNHGAAVIFPSSKIQAVDYFVKLNDDLAKQNLARELQHQKVMQQEAANMKSTAAGVIYPFQGLMNDVKNQYIQTRGAALTSKDPTVKLQLNQQANLLEQKAAQISALSKQSEAQQKAEQAAYLKNPDVFDAEHTKYMNSDYGTTMAKTVEDAMYKPGVAKTKDTFNKDLKDFIFKRVGNYDVTDPLVNGGGLIHTQNGIPLKALVSGATEWVDNTPSAQRLIKQGVELGQGTPEQVRQNLITHVATVKAAENSADITQIKTDVNKEQFVPIGAGVKRTKPFAPKEPKGTTFSNGEYSGKGNSIVTISEDDKYTNIHLGYKAGTDKAEVLIRLPDGTSTKYIDPQPKIDKRTGTLIIKGERLSPKSVGAGLSAKTEWVPTGRKEEVWIENPETKKEVMKELETKYGVVFKYNDDGTINLNAEKNPNVSYAKDYRTGDAKVKAEKASAPAAGGKKDKSAFTNKVENIFKK